MRENLPFGPEFGFGLYIHWPYCARICPYCDFNVYAAKDRDSQPLLYAIIADIHEHRRRLPDHPPLGSVYLGGGTPSLLRADEMSRLLAAAEDTFGLTPDCEITLEANPNDVLRAQPIAWRDAGVNRLSVGLQSLHDDALRFLGRDHDAQEGIEAVGCALSAFENVSIDLIYARPGQSLIDWRSELEAALDLGAPHLSLYELTIEARTAFGRRAARGELVAMPDNDQAALYELTRKICDAHGLPAYEVSNHARGERFRSRHNLTYWRGGDWIGVGPGAHGRLTVEGRRLETVATVRPKDYLISIKQCRARGEALPDGAAGEELLLMGLRTVEGISRKRVESSLSRPISETAWREFIQFGLMADEEDRLALTAEGRLLADRIGADLLV